MTEPKFRREFTKDQLAGKHHAKLTEELNKAFLQECDAQRRGPSDMIRVILEDRYAAEIHYPKSVEVEVDMTPPQRAERHRKREVA
jgi:predicted anti-sigma-YlaC factor YlaD